MVDFSILPEPSASSSSIGARSGSLNDTIYFGGTRWAADSLRWEAIKDSVWTFDTGVGSFIKESGKTYPDVDPYKPAGFHGGMEGWMGWDLTYTPVTFFRRLSSSDPRWEGPPCVGATAGLEGNASFWAGVLPSEAESLGFVSGKGYGNLWHVCIEHTFDYPGGNVALSFQYRNDTEPEFDYTYVFCDTGGTDRVEIASYTGLLGGAANFNLSPGSELPVVAKPITLQFCFESDVAWSDEDGLSPTNCGAFALDNIGLTGAITYFADFESSSDGWTLSPPRPGRGGDWSNLAFLGDLPDLPPPLDSACALHDSVLVFFNADEKHSLYQNNVAISPWINFERFGMTSKAANFVDLDGYFDLPLRNYIFVEVFAQWYPDTSVVTGSVGRSDWTSTGNFYRFGGSPTCRTVQDTRVNLNVIPPGVSEARIAVGVINYCGFFLDCGGISNSSPWFDNVRFATYNLRTIQDVIDAVASGDTVWVVPGTYTQTGNVNLDFRGKSIVLKSTAGPERTIIDGSGQYRGLVCEHGEDSAAVIGFTFRNCAGPQDEIGTYQNGGAAYLGPGASARFEDCVITQCKGGGIFADRDSNRLELFNCTFSNNDLGGGVRAEFNGVGTARQCRFLSNSGPGAVFFGDALVEDCVFSDNSTGLIVWYSGSVHACQFTNNRGIGFVFGASSQFGCGSSVHVSNCTSSGNKGSSGAGINGCGGEIDSCRVIGNQAFFHGGGISVIGTRCRRSIIENNEAGYWGGGVSMGGGSSLDSCIIRGNVAVLYGGGGISGSTGVGWFAEAPLDIRGCIVTGNQSPGRGGGMALDPAGVGAPIRLTGNTVSGNHAQQGGGIYSAGAFSAHRSIIWGNAADSSGSDVFLEDSTSTFTCSALDSFGVTGPGYPFYDGPQIFENPKFCLPQPASNAPTVLGYYTLASGSLCLPMVSPCDSLIGALGEGCNVVSVEPGPQEPPLLNAPGIHAGPNPFGGTLTIHYLSPVGTDPDLEIFSVDGRLIAKWALRPGWGTVNWDGRDPIGKPVASGIYLLRYTAGDLRVVRRVVRISR
jgi:parallel beta helix pectate lyase-like protein